ncbi:MAG: hypothetical protein IJU70_09795 [Lentisphaeria bacterium]|nr:hypothetical protein [Lentisphaeria bacterium]
MKDRRNLQSGQAITELVILLIGFVAVFLGLLFVCGLADGDINIFLIARNRAELAAAGSPSAAVSGAEFGSPAHDRIDIYSADEPLVFSPRDTPNRRASNSLDGFPGAFTDESVSAPESTDNDYLLQAKLKRWKSLKNAGHGAFASDYVTDLALINALEAADLISGRASGVSENTLLSNSAQKAGTADALHRTFLSWFGVKFSGNALVNAPGNRVYMPVFSR